MRLQGSLEQLDATSSYLREISFTHPKAFQNTLLSRVSITSVIRDAEPHESALFTASGARRADRALPDTGASEILRDRESSLPVLLDAIERVNAIYPVDAAEATASVALMRHKHATLSDSIAALERDVESQRRRLDLLSSGRAYHGAEDEDVGAQSRQAATGSTEEAVAVVTDEMLEAEEAEVTRLEQLIEAKSRR